MKHQKKIVYPGRLGKPCVNSSDAAVSIVNNIETNLLTKITSKKKQIYDYIFCSILTCFFCENFLEALKFSFRMILYLLVYTSSLKC